MNENSKRQYSKNELTYEKMKLHVKYLFIISGIIFVIGISVGLGDNNNFSAEISMASTISSIILSAIAIVMSIYGENKNSYVQNKIIETADGLSDVIEQMKKIDNSILVNLEERLKELGNIENELRNVKGDVNEVKGMIDNVLHAEVTNNVKDELSEEDIMKAHKIIFSKLKSITKPKLYNKFCEMVEYVITLFGQNKVEIINKKEVYEYMSVKRLEKNKEVLEMLWMICFTCNLLGMNRNNKHLNQNLLEFIHAELTESHENEILQFHSNYN